MQQLTLFERLGGETNINFVSERLYSYLLKDDRVSHFFKNLDMDKQIKHLSSFLVFAFGGKESFSGQSMRAVHKPLVENQGLSDKHFNIVADYLIKILTDFGVSDQTVKEVSDLVETLRADVLNK